MYVCCRLSEHDSDSLYQRLESQVREVVIEMKVRLLKELTVDHRVEPRAHQFVALLLSEYKELCASSRRATFLATFVRTFYYYFYRVMHYSAKRGLAITFRPSVCL